MGTRRATFTKAEIERALKAARATFGAAARVEIERGPKVVILGGDGAAQSSADEAANGNPWDTVE